MVHITTTHIVLCLTIFHSTKSKNDLSTSNSWKVLCFSKSYALTHQKPMSNQLYSSDKKVIDTTKTHNVYVWWSSSQPRANIIWYLHSAHQNNWKHPLSRFHMLPNTRN